jgi:hypothetical protein
MHSQIIEIKGRVIGTNDTENIHIINITSKFYTITNKDGEFKINAKLDDTLKVFSLQYKHININIDADIISKKGIVVQLAESINELEEVVIGNILTGNLALDVKNNSVKPAINFYDIGIPGYLGRPKTQNERRLFTATYGGFGSIDRILNGISGRTKKLKIYVELDKKKELLNILIAKFSHILFDSNILNEDVQNDFFIFCSEEIDFVERYLNKTDFEIYVHLQDKLKSYKILNGLN